MRPDRYSMYNFRFTRIKTCFKINKLKLHCSSDVCALVIGVPISQLMFKNIAVLNSTEVQLLFNSCTPLEIQLNHETS